MDKNMDKKNCLTFMNNLLIVFFNSINNCYSSKYTSSSYTRNMDINNNDDNDILFEEDYVAIENGELYNNYLQLHKIYKCENYDKI